MLTATTPSHRLIQAASTSGDAQVVTLDTVAKAVLLSQQTTVDAFFSEMEGVARSLNGTKTGYGFALALSDVRVPYRASDGVTGSLAGRFVHGEYTVLYIPPGAGKTPVVQDRDCLQLMAGWSAGPTSASIDAYRKALLAKMLELQPIAPI